jgi:hypothetical protein
LHFDKDTGLCTNFTKSEIFRIRCDGIDIPQVLGEFQAETGRFLAAISGYLFDLADTDDQVIIDKVATKLPKWKGRLLNKPGRLTLVNSVLTSVVLYHMMVFPLSKWAIRRIDNIRQGFLWQGSENAQGGNCMVNWQRAQRSKKLGGLGILDLAKFNLTLQLSWH